jgi:RNA polymerase sigma-70 factor (ECF subfamily)
MVRTTSRAPAAAGNDPGDLRAARDGDQDAAARLVARHAAAMVRTARRVLGRYLDGEGDDVVQEAFIAALTTPALPAGDVGAWLRAITARKALDSLRSAARRPAVGLPDPSVVAAGGGAEDSGTRIEVLALRQALARLSPADRAVLTLVDLEGASMAEAAAALGVTYVAVRLRAVRARRKLARLLRPVEDKAPRGAAVGSAPGQNRPAGDVKPEGGRPAGGRESA